MLHWSKVCSLHVSGPVVSTIPTRQEELILTHFKLVLVNRGLISTIKQIKTFALFKNTLFFINNVNNYMNCTTEHKLQKR